MNIKKIIGSFTIMITAVAFLSSCGPSPESLLKKAYRPSADKDVTSASDYNFSAFAGSIWKTKVQTGIAGVKRYTGANDSILVPPSRFDRTHPDYDPGRDCHPITILPTGTRIRIERLMEDQGAWGGVQVEVTVEEGTNIFKLVYLGPELLIPNRFYGGGLRTNTKWEANPKMLEPIVDNVARP